MIAVYVINFALVFPAILTLAYHIPVLDDALNDPTLYPAVYVLRQGMSTTWMTVFITVVSTASIAAWITF